MMYADRNSSLEERQKIIKFMLRIKSPWDESEIDERMREFVMHVKNTSYDSVLNETCNELKTISDPR